MADRMPNVIVAPVKRGPKVGTKRVAQSIVVPDEITVKIMT